MCMCKCMLLITSRFLSIHHQPSLPLHPPLVPQKPAWKRSLWRLQGKDIFQKMMKCGRSHVDTAESATAGPRELEAETRRTSELRLSFTTRLGVFAQGCNFYIIDNGRWDITIWNAYFAGSIASGSERERGRSFRWRCDGSEPKREARRRWGNPEMTFQTCGEREFAPK